MPNREYDDRVTLIVLGLSTAVSMAIGIIQPFLPLVLSAGISLGAITMLVRGRGSAPLRQSWWFTVGAVALPVSIIVYALVDVAQSGMTWNHLLVIATFAVYVAIFVVPQLLASRRQRY